jgi:hypothetical protein
MADDEDIETIMPPFKKYCGCVRRQRPTSTRWVAEFGLRGPTRNFDSREKAVEWLKTLNALENNKRVKNIIYRKGDVYSCNLSCGKAFKFDEQDLDLVQSHTWCLRGNYVTTQFRVDGKQFMKQLTYYLKGTPPQGEVIDHKNRDPLDNRRANLRFVSPRVNVLNSKIHPINNSGVKGVSERKKEKCWRVTWQIAPNKSTTRKFSFFGDREGAKQKAIAWRKQMEQEIPVYNQALHYS